MSEHTCNPRYAGGRSWSEADQTMRTSVQSTCQKDWGCGSKGRALLG
jgi:hypothetical protein